MRAASKGSTVIIYSGDKVLPALRMLSQPQSTFCNSGAHGASLGGRRCGGAGTFRQRRAGVRLLSASSCQPGRHVVATGAGGAAGAGLWRRGGAEPARSPEALWGGTGLCSQGPAIRGSGGTAGDGRSRPDGRAACCATACEASALLPAGARFSLRLRGGGAAAIERERRRRRRRRRRRLGCSSRRKSRRACAGRRSRHHSLSPNPALAQPQPGHTSPNPALTLP